MDITILDNRDVIIEEFSGSQNENNASVLNFNFPDTLANSNKKIVFITDDGIFWDLITNNSYRITNRITKYRNVSAYVWLIDTINNIDFRSKVWELNFNPNENAENEMPTEEQIDGFDSIISQLNSALEEIELLKNRVIELESKIESP